MWYFGAGVSHLKKIVIQRHWLFRCPSFVTWPTNFQSDITTPKVKWNIFVFYCIVDLGMVYLTFSRKSCHITPILRVRAFFHKTVRVCHVYCNFKIGFTCRITVIFGTLKDGSLLINTLASNICFNYRNIFQNGVDALPKIVDAFLSKSSNFHLVWIIR